MRLATVVVLGLLVCVGCRSDDADLAKLDAPLRMKLEQLAASHDREVLSVLGKCGRQIDAAMRAEMSKSGADVTSVVGDIFTARIASDRIPRLARLSFVTQLQLSQTSQPSAP